MIEAEKTEARNTVSPNQNDKFSQSNQSDQSCEVRQTETSDQGKTSETIGKVDPICQIPPNIAMMPPGSGGLITWLLLITGLLAAIAEVLRETSGFIRTWRNDDRDS